MVLYTSIFIFFRLQTGRNKILQKMVAWISWVQSVYT